MIYLSLVTLITLLTFGKPTIDYMFLYTDSDRWVEGIKLNFLRTMRVLLMIGVIACIVGTVLGIVDYFYNFNLMETLAY